MTNEAKYKRVVLKLSGEALAGEKGYGIDPNVVNSIAKQIKEVLDCGLEIAVVNGGGNIWRGLSGANKGMDRATADYMGMLATVINSLALQDALEQIGVPTRVQTAIEMRQIAEPYIRRRAVRHLEKERVVIFAGVYDADPATHPEAKKFDHLDYIDVINRHLSVMDTTAISLCMDNKIPIIVFNIETKGNILKAAMGTVTGTTVGGK